MMIGHIQLELDNNTVDFATLDLGSIFVFDGRMFIKHDRYTATILSTGDTLTMVPIAQCVLPVSYREFFEHIRNTIQLEALENDNNLGCVECACDWDKEINSSGHDSIAVL